MDSAKDSIRSVRQPRASLEHSTRDGCAHAVMLGAGEAYLATFAIALGMGGLALGLLSSLPLLMGSLAQLRVVTLLDRRVARKALVVRAAFGQALCWLPIIALPLLFPAHASALLLLSVVAYQTLGGLLSPAWSSWMGDLVPPRVRGSYFGRREQLRLAFQVAGLIGAGLCLSVGRTSGHESVGFVVIFAVALVARLVSVRHLDAMHEPAHHAHSSEHQFTLLSFLRRTPQSNFGRFSVYVALVMAATNMAGPFFSLFMLRDLGFSYLQFTAASVAVLVGQVITLRAWGRLGDRFGNRFLLKVTGLLVPLVPVPWLWATEFEAVLVWQLLGGMIWAGFNLCTLNFLFDAVSPPKRARCVAYYNLLSNGAQVVGAVIGGLLIAHLPAAIRFAGISLTFQSGVQLLFLLSAILRLVLALSFLPTIREVRTVRSFGEVLVRIAGLAAARGARFTVIPAVSDSEVAAELDGDIDRPSADRPSDDDAPPLHPTRDE